MLKKLGAAMLVGTMLAGGACYAHEQRDHAKTLAAKAIGIDESKLTFHSIKLKCGDKHQPTEDFKPIYKVKCCANGVKYEVKLDAVSGNLIDFDC